MATYDDFISSLTGKEIDAAVLLILQNFVKSFNGRSGYNIVPSEDDYNAVLIKTVGLDLPENVPQLPVNQNTNSYLEVSLQLFSCLFEVLTKSMEETVLWTGAQVASGTVSMPLSDSLDNYDEIYVYEYWDSESNCANVKIISVDQLIYAQENNKGSGILCTTYDNYHIWLKTDATHQVIIHTNGTGNASQQKFYKIAGVKRPKRVLQEWLAEHNLLPEEPEENENQS